MFFSRFFRKDFAQLKEKGDSLFKAERFAEARTAYQDALEKISTALEGEAELAYLTSQLSLIGNRLAEMNILEAEVAMRGGNPDKAHEHLVLAMEQADDVSVRENAELMLKRLMANEVSHEEPAHHNGAHNCTSCSGSSQSAPEEKPVDIGDHLDTDEQFQLLIQTLPAPLPERYEGLGEKFAYNYLLAHGDQLLAAQKGYRELIAAGENDILLYESAQVSYRLGERRECEAMLKRALALNSQNPLCHLSLAQLYIDTRRLPEAVGVLQHMLDNNFFVEQALIMLGDVYLFQGDVEQGITVLTKALQVPSLKKIAAERLLPVLNAQGRTDEANFLVKTCLKGCC
jgi:tetratricopeptide (TPR) repeat protein